MQYLHQICFCLFIQNDSRGQLFIIIYVDNLVIGEEHIRDIKHNKRILSDRFETTNMKELNYFLGVEVTLDDIVTPQ